MEKSRRKQIQMEDDYEEALEKAIQLSLIEHQQRREASTSQPDHKGGPSFSNPPPQSNLGFKKSGKSAALSATSAQPYLKQIDDDLKGSKVGLKGQVKDLSLEGTNASRKGELAIPLCLPDNYEWDPKTGKCTKTGDKRSSLYLIQEALDQLKNVKDRVCVVSISGPLRRGKSYLLGEAFNQPDVFPLGHDLDAATMGIWLWIVPEKYKDSNDQEFTVVLLDSEGTDDPSGKVVGDRQIFTLTVLLASMLIYNSPGVPTRSDVEGLDFIVNLSQQIQIRSQSGSSSGYKDSSYFRKTFPYFFWVLRDVTLSIPTEYEDVKDYLLRKVFHEQDSSPSGHKHNDVVDSILNFFPDFDAFTLPSPSVDLAVMKNLNKNKRRLNPSFLSGLEQFKFKMNNILAPKHSFNDGEFVTGEALATLVVNYVAALNTPGAVPNVQGAWVSFISTKCSEVKDAAIQLYESTMTSQLDGALPCDSEEIRRVQHIAVEESMKNFQTETVQISAASSKDYLEELMKHMENGLKRWEEENQQLTKEFCQKLLLSLKKKYLDSILKQRRGPEGSSVSFDRIEKCFSDIEQDFQKLARGAKDVCTQEFFKFQPELQSEMENHKEHLKQLKDYAEKLAKERRDKAIREKEAQRMQEENARLLEELRTQQKELELLKKKQEGDIIRLEEKFQKDMEEQENQMQNIMKAKVDELQRDKDVIVEQNKGMKEEIQQIRHDVNEKSHQIRKLKMASVSKNMAVVAIDFGTTYSGFAFSFNDQSGQGGIHMNRKWDPEGASTLKTPTSILLGPNKEFDSFGYEADRKYAHFTPGKAKEYYYLRHFKMELHITKDLDRTTQLTAANGKKVDAMTVFSLSMEYLKDEAVKTIREVTQDQFYNASDFQWVLTVPAIWTAAAKQFMREAAYKAGIASPDNTEQLIIALEPEAGAIFCKEREMKDFKDQTGDATVSDVLVRPGIRYVVMDIGGGTLDVTAHESLADGTIKEIYKVTGGPYGGIYVDKEFVSLLENLFRISDFRIRYPAEWLEMMNDFESKKTGKRALEGKVTRVKLPPKFLETVSSTAGSHGRLRDVEILNNEYLCLGPDAMKQLFQKVVSGIVSHMTEVLNQPELKSVNCLFMVGGFAESAILQKAIETAFSSRCKILIPNDPGIAVVQGATMFGRKPTVVTSRVMATTYGFLIYRNFDPEVDPPDKKVIIEGVAKCKEVFDVIVKENDAVNVGETKLFTRRPIYSNQKSASFLFFTSTNPNVKYTTESSVGPSIGEVRVKSPDTSKGKNRDIELSIFFGGTEIKATAIDKTSGNVATVKLDFLSKS